MSHDVLIVGSGHGGAQAAIALRQNGFSGSIGLLGKEPELPYERPPLSKDYLAGEKARDAFRLRPAAFWDEKGIERITGERIVSVDPSAHEVAAESGRTFEYGSLIWAAGGHARKISCPGSELEGIHTIRTLACVDRLKADLSGRNRVLVVGGGYIGLEAAAVLTKLGKSVTLIEALPRLLSRVAGEDVSSFYERTHRDHGVDIRCNAALAGFDGASRVEAAILADGTRIATDLVIVGIGIVPAVAPLIEAGAQGGNGVLVDGECRTTLPDIFAIGDCALHVNAYGPAEPIRIESVQNANDMANAVARTLTGTPTEYRALPWFWSNQYGHKLQTVGLNHGYDRCLLRGEPASGSFSVLYLKDGRVIALDCVDAVKDYVQGRKLIESGAVLPDEQLVDAATPFKELLKEV